MRATTPGRGRRGAILALVAAGLVMLFGFIALAVDVGVMAMARTQAQNAADTAATAGARALNGSRPNGVAESAAITMSDNNYSGAAPQAIAAAAANSIVGVATPTPTITVGKYLYDSSQSKFLIYLPSIPANVPSNDLANYTTTDNTAYNWSLVRASISYQGKNTFATVMPGGSSQFGISTSAIAIHRPRDVALVLDFTGSMGYGSSFYRNTRSAGSTGSTSNNPETVYPKFGHYSDTTGADLPHNSPTISYQGAYAYTVGNDTAQDASNNMRAPIIDSTVLTGNPTFLQNPVGSSAVAAWPSSSLPPASYATTPGGDVPLRISNDTGSTFADTLANVFGGSAKKNSTFETNGYQSTAVNRSGTAFAGYTQGPSYWGKTFFIWPPDPRTSGNEVDGGPRDWRTRFFLKGDGVSKFGASDAINGALYNSGGQWQQPGSGTYQVNYPAVLAWIKKTPNPFPPKLWAGRIRYYKVIPTALDGSDSSADAVDVAFWKGYIDYVLTHDGYGSSYTWNSAAINTSFTKNGDTGTNGPNRYMDYTDTPERPRMQFWFGPMSMLYYIDQQVQGTSTNVSQGSLPGNATQAPLYVCKLGIQGALQNFKSNHPNDLVSLIVFSQPKTSATSGGRFNQVRAPMGRLYQRMQDSLWFPPYTIDNPGKDIAFNSAYDAETPRAGGSTSFPMGLMMAYNQLSGSSTARNFDPTPAPVGNAGGNGRKGARKMVIFETDGIPNTPANAGFTNGGPYNSYYNILYNSTTPSSSQFPSGASNIGDLNPTVITQLNAICQQLANPDSSSGLGYSTTRNPMLIHTIGFGPAFGSNNPQLSGILAVLQNMQYIGNTQSSPTTPLPSYKIINDTDTNNVTLLQQALTNIMEDGVQVSLIR